ncbi:S1C family serine protease [Corynebacterium tapiri]|uniref:PDZ domain-containing protein n=1 Tax=Corynebacterium tapiri TaxID=1448266 RepID=A0A5C4U6B3_9CORY|nr:trypsin-like peptidase domain-containing protein [Corynebacterium tapiri]TNM00426.1 PDZ domain-containing protein [Corynebacterium tapiri]
MNDSAGSSSSRFTGDQNSASSSFHSPEDHPTSSYERVDSPYQTAPPNPQAGTEPLERSYEASPVYGASAQPQPKKSVGLGTALALMLAGSVVTGGVVGVAANQLGEGDSTPETSSASEALRQRPADVAPAPDGSVEQVATAVLPAVVSIQVATATAAGEGSGSIITPDGFVLTNHHVIAGAEGGRIQVTLNDGSTHDAEYVASDPATDIGIIKIEGVKDLPTISFGDSSQLRVGQEVVAVGAPLGLSGTVTSGIVSATQRPVRASQEGGESSLIDAIQTDAAINPGNSGGPLVDMNGNLIGMNSVIASLSSGAGGQAGSIGLGFAIPSNFAQRVARQLIEDGKASQPLLGVMVDGRNPVDGATVAGVEPGGPAEKAGIKEGDVIVRLNDRLIDSSDALIAAVRSRDFGETVTLEVHDANSNETRKVEATLSK